MYIYIYIEFDESVKKLVRLYSTTVYARNSDIVVSHLIITPSNSVSERTILHGREQLKSACGIYIEEE